MAETVGPQLEGSIELNIKEFRAGVSELTKSVTTISKTFDRLNKSIGAMQKNLNNTSKSYQNTSRAAKQAGDVQSKAAQKAADLEQKKANAIARAANRIYSMEQSVKKSNATQQQQTAVISRLRSSLQQYGDSINRGKMSTVEMDNANTKLSTSLGAATRQLKEYTKSTQQSERQQVANMKALNEADVSYRRAADAVNRSEMSTEQKDAAIKRLNKSLIEVKRNTERYGTGTTKTVSAQNQLKKSIADTNIQARNANKAFREKKMESWRAQMMDLTSSVQLALGPLSGIASRIQALTALFNRNAIAVAGLFASLTGITVAFGKAIKSGIEAERQLRSLEGVVSGLGETADVTGKELFDLGTRMGAALLTSAAEARKAAGAVASFGSISKDQFEGVIVAAQGLTETMGGNLQQNVKKLGRLLDDPVTNFDSLREAGVAFSEETKETVTALRAQGRIFQSNEVLLDRFSFATEAARESADSLAGDLDTAGENLNRFFEVMFTESGAAEVAREQVQRFTEVVNNLVTSDAGKEFGENLATVLSVVGNSINLVLENLRTLGNLLAGAVVYSIGKYVAALAVKLGVTRKNIAAAYQYIVAQKSVAVSTRAATVATKSLSFAMRATPWGMIISTLGVMGAMWAMNSDKTDEFSGKVKNVKEELEGLELLSKGERNLVEETLGSTNEVQSDIDKSLSVIEDSIEKKVREINSKSTEISLLRDKGIEPSLESFSQLEKLNDSLESLESRYKSLKSQQDLLEESSDAIVKTAKEQNKEYQKTGINAKAVAESVMGLRKEYLKDEVALENVIKKRKEVVANLKVLEDANDNEVKNRQEAIRVAKAAIKQLDEERKELEASTGAAFKASRAYKTLTNSLSDMQAQLRLASATEMGSAFDRLKEQINLDKELSNLRQQLSGLSDTEYRKLAEAIDLNISKMQSEEAIQKSVTNAYLNKASALRQEINAQNALRSAREAAQGIEESAMSGVGSAENDFQKGIEDIEALGRSKSLEDQKQFQQTALQLRLDYLEQVKQIEQGASDLTRFKPLSEVEQLEKDLERRRETLAAHYDTESQQYKDHLAKMEKNAESQKMWLKVGEFAQTGADAFQNAMSAMESAGRESTSKYQDLAVAQAVMAQGVAIAKAYQEGGPIAGPILAASMAFKLGAQIKQIKSQEFAQGGEVKGPGTQTSDSVPAMLSAGEFVMRASAVRKFGMDTLNRMNEGKMPKMREGGSIMPIPMNSGSGGGSNVEVNIYNQSSNVEVEERRSTDSMGNQRLDMYIKDTVNSGLASGSFDRSLGGSFGLTRQGRGR